MVARGRKQAEQDEDLPQEDPADRISAIEAGKILMKHRSTVAQMAKRGELSVDADGKFSREECEMMADELLAARSDPATVHLVKVMLAQQTHQERLQGILHTSYMETLKMQQQTNAQLLQQNEKLQAAQVDFYTAYRDIMQADDERKLALHEAEASGKRQEQFIELAGAAVADYMGNRSVSGKLQGFVGRILKNPEKMQRVIEALGDDAADLAELAKLAGSEIMGGDEQAAAE